MPKIDPTDNHIDLLEVTRFSAHGYTEFQQLTQISN